MLPGRVCATGISTIVNALSNQSTSGSKPGMLRTVLVLGRTSNLPTVWTNVLAGWFLAGGAWDWQIGWLILGVSALYFGGMTLNDAFDVKWDRKHAPERPVPSGAISERGVWVLGIGWMLVGVALVVVFTHAGLGWLAALVAAILLYDWSHKKWSGAMWVMGACRTLVYLVAASSVTIEAPTLAAVGTMGLGLGFYVAAITLLAKGERKKVVRSSTGILPFLLLLSPLLLVALDFVLRDKFTFQAPVSPPVIIGCGVLFTIWCIRLGRRRLANNIGHGVTTLLAGICVVDALYLSLVDWRLSLICVAFLPVVRISQRYIPAT